MTDRELFWYLLATLPPSKSDAIVVLAGEDAGPRFAVGKYLFANQAAPFIVVSGGLADPPQKITATTLRERYIGAGIAPHRIVVEDQSQNTHEQAVNVIALAKERGWTHLTLVASCYHAPRVFLSFLGYLQAIGDDGNFMLSSVGADHASWYQPPEGISATRLQLAELEAAKIVEYQMLGHVASYESGLAYLERIHTPQKAA